MRSLSHATHETGQKPDLRDFPLKLPLGTRPLDLLPECKFEAILDDALLLQLDATTDPGGRIVPIRPEESYRVARARTSQLPRNLPTAQVREAVQAYDGRFADPLECLTFAAMYPDVQRQSPIVTLDWSRTEGRWTKYAMLTVDAVGKRVLRSVCPPSWPSAWRYLIIVP